MPTVTAQAEPRPQPRPGPRLLAAARRPVAADSVAVFRIGFGLVATFGSIRFLARGWVDSLYLAPQNHLSYPGFDWIHPLPAPGMQLHMVGLALLGVGIALGYRHRLCSVLFVIGFTYTELIDAVLYLNHYWFVTLTGVLLAVLPVHHRWSLDARAGRVQASRTVSSGVVWVLRGQLGLVYVFAGLAKLNADWLLNAQPLQLWLADRTHLPIIGSFLDEPLVAYLASWSSALFDCTVVAWLLWRRSRPWAYAAVIAFHLGTAALFQIGVFPWVMIVSGLVFFDPDWPGKVWGVLRRRIAATQAPSKMADPGGATARLSRPAVVFLVVLALFQVLLPLRHYAYSGNVRWTEEGYYWSWRVMLTEKTGHVEYRVTDAATGQTWLTGPELVLTDWQTAQANVRPDLIHATARLIADHYRAEGFADLEVRADAWVSMNGRRPERIVDPRVDLLSQPRSLAPAGWILSHS